MPRKKKYAHDEIPAADHERAVATQAALEAKLEVQKVWLAEVAYFGAGFKEWRQRIIKNQNFDPAGFYEELLSGKYEVNAEGLGGDDAVGIMPFVPRETQRMWCREIIWHRWAATDETGWARYQVLFPVETAKYGRPRGRFMRLVAKNRRAGFTTGEVMVAVCDGEANPGANVAISSYDVKEGLENVSELLRIALGDSKDAAPGATGMAQKRFKTKSRTLIRLLSPGESMGRGFSYNHLLWTEVDYLEDIEGALKSVRPSIRKDAFACIVLESTIRKDAQTGFKDYIARSLKGLTAFRVYFQGWMRDETATAKPTEADLAAIAAREAITGSGGYEFTVLRDKHGATDEQIVWWRQRFHEDADHSLDSMMEMYPTELDEAMLATTRGEFLYKDSLDWIGTVCCEPTARLRVSISGMVELTDPRDWKSQSHMLSWVRPEWGQQYVIGADIADEAERSVGEEGSENYAVVVNRDNGDVVAEWHGYATAPEFANTLHGMATWYNGALVVPEANRGLGVIRHLSDNLQYSNIYRRESFTSDTVMQSDSFGFYTTAQTRPILVERVQDVVNNRKMLIRSKKMLEQLIGFAERRGRPQKKQAVGKVADDGCIALALATFGHDGLSSGRWRAWSAKESPRPIPQQQQHRPHGVIFDDEEESGDYRSHRHGMGRT